MLSASEKPKDIPLKKRAIGLVTWEKNFNKVVRMEYRLHRMSGN